MDSIRIKRGSKVQLPRELPLGELAFCTDTRELYVGMGEGIKPRPVTNTEITEHLAEWKDKYQEVSDQFQAKYDGLEQEYATRLTEVSSQLDTIANNQLSFIDISTIVKSGSDEDIAPILNELLKLGKKIYFPVGEWKIKSKVLISQPNAKNNSFIIDGEGNNTTINFVGDNAYIEELLGDSQNHNFHTRVIKNLRFVGDTSNKCWLGKGANVSFINVNFENFEIAFESDVVAKYYFENCVFYRNIFGVLTRDMTTTITFNRCLMYGHDNIGGCACLFNGFNENIKFIDCVIPSNKECSAIIFNTDFSGQCKFDNVYFEVNGDYEKGIYSIDNRSTTNGYDIAFTNSRMIREYHTNPQAGLFNLQNVSFNECFISMELDNCDSISLTNCTLNDIGCSNTKKPITFNGVNRIGRIWGESSARGCGFRIPTAIKEVDSYYTNKIINPFAEELIFNTSNGTNNPSFSLDTENKLGNKNSEKVVFHNSIGTPSNNNFYPLNTFTPSSIESNNIIIYSMFVKANKTAKLRFLESGDRQLILQDFEVGQDWRKFIFMGRNQSDATVNTNGVIYPIESYDNLECWFTGLVCYSNVGYLPNDVSEMLAGYFNY